MLLGSCGCGHGSGGGVILRFLLVFVLTWISVLLGAAAAAAAVAIGSGGGGDNACCSWTAPAAVDLAMTSRLLRAIPVGNAHNETNQSNPRRERSLPTA